MLLFTENIFVYKENGILEKNNEIKYDKKRLDIVMKPWYSKGFELIQNRLLYPPILVKPTNKH